MAPILTDSHGVTVRSNSTFPAVSMRVFVSGNSGKFGDRARLLFLHRRTKVAKDLRFPDWFEPRQNAEGIPLRGDMPQSFLVNGQRLYPRADLNVIVVSASDDEDPKVSSVPYTDYEALPWNDTNTLWNTLVNDSD